jgi:serine/threonine protein kinase
MHRDIKGSNVLVDKNGVCKLAGCFIFYLLNIYIYIYIFISLFMGIRLRKCKNYL